MDEKAAFLADIRRQLGFGAEEVRSVEECPQIFEEPDDLLIMERIRYRTHVEKQALLNIFQENAVPLNLDVHVVDSLESAADIIAAIIRRTAPEFSPNRQVVQHDHADLAALQLWKKLAGEPIQIHTTYPADMQVREKSVESSIGLTVAEWAIAESATIVQLSGAGRPRSTSLLPSVHIALIRLENFLADLGEAYALLRKSPPRESFVFITGPSKTADIEAHLVHGAHGPAGLHLVVIDEHMSRDVNLKGSGLFDSGETDAV